MYENDQAEGLTIRDKQPSSITNLWSSLTLIRLEFYQSNEKIKLCKHPK